METDKRKLLLTLPDDVYAFVGADRALNSSKFVDKEGKPKFSMLGPNVDTQGKLVGVQKMTKLVLRKEG